MRRTDRRLPSDLFAVWLFALLMAAASVQGDETHSIAAQHADHSITRQASVSSFRERESIYSLLDDLSCSTSTQDWLDKPLDDKKCKVKICHWDDDDDDEDECC